MGRASMSSPETTKRAAETSTGDELFWGPPAKKEIGKRRESASDGRDEGKRAMETYSF